MASLLQLDRITKSFGAARALRGVSFTLEPGEVHALLGENGAGKSTLIKVITGAHTPDGGTMEVGGEAVAHLTPARARALGIASIYQQPALFPDLSVAENIALRLEKTSPAHLVRWRERRSRAAELLHRIGADIDADKEVRALSMPEQQLVEIACALGSGARIVIMDEPTASLTQKEQHLLFAVVRELRANGVGVIYISHRLEEIFALADRVTVLRDGESVGTNRVDALNETALIRMMVGREISAIYPPSESAPGEVVLRLRGVGCAASGVHGIDLEVRTGEVVGLAGLVGAGRTELARILFGITPSDAGEIQLGEPWRPTLRRRPDPAEDASTLPEQRPPGPLRPVAIRCPREAISLGIAYVPEDRRRHGVILEMPLAANTTMAIHPQLFPGAWLGLGAERRLTRDFIRALAVKTSGPDAPGGSLSGGNQQKVVLARWLATKPKLLILDEPTQGVDVGAKGEIHKIIRRLAKEGLAVLLISSDLPEILGMSDRIAVLRGGTIVAELPANADAHDVMAAALGQTGKEAA